MKSLLWMLLALCLAANVLFSVVLPESATQIVLSVVSGAGVLGSGAGLWVLRDRDPVGD